jgi:hypothetical protein
LTKEKLVEWLTYSPVMLVAMTITFTPRPLGLFLKLPPYTLAGFDLISHEVRYPRQGCQIFLGKNTKTGKIYQITTNFTKCWLGLGVKFDAYLVGLASNPRKKLFTNI